MKILRIYRQPFWSYCIGFFVSMNLSPVAAVFLGRGIGMIFFSMLALFLYRDALKRGTVSYIISNAINENKFVFLLVMYYGIVVLSWFHTPYPIGYEDVSMIWKTHLGNVMALLVGFLLSRRPELLKFILIFCAPFVLYYCFAVGRILTATGLEARNFVKDPEMSGLGATTNWQAIAMYGIAVLGYAFSAKNWIMKIVGLAFVAYLARAVLRAGYATPFALFLIGGVVFVSVFFFWGKKTKYSGFLKVFIVSIGLACAIYVFHSIANQDLSDSASKSISSRFKNILEDPRGGGYDVENSRFSGMMVGWKSFLESPLIGKGGPYPSIQARGASAGHHALVDYLGQFGILGGGAYALFTLICMLNVFKRYKRTHSWFDASAFAIAVMFFVGGVVNPGWYGMPMTLLFVLSVPFRSKDVERYSYGMRPVWVRRRQPVIPQYYHRY